MADTNHDTTKAETETKLAPTETPSQSKTTPDMSNILDHIKNLETTKQDLEKALKEKEQRIDRLSQKTREGMQSALDTLMSKWMNAVECKNEKVKDEFKGGLEKLFKNSAEDNGVWQMMVAASSLYERQEHNLDTLQKENNALKLRVDGMYASPDSRIVGEKSKADTQLDRVDVRDEIDVWGDFAKHIGSMH